ncbi:MAG: hypothetical protein ACE1ZE_05470, partial [Candidatus Binatia bacterium]
EAINNSPRWRTWLSSFKPFFSGSYLAIRPVSTKAVTATIAVTMRNQADCRRDPLGMRLQLIKNLIFAESGSGRGGATQSGQRIPPLQQTVYE